MMKKHMWRKLLLKLTLVSSAGDELRCRSIAIVQQCPFVTQSS